jgi:hypothetical protein
LKKKIVIALLLVIVFLLPSVTGRTALTDVAQTIPPVVVSTATATAGCTTLSLTPGSVISGGQGWIMASCSNAPAISFQGQTETPAFLLSTGWDSINIIKAGLSPCQNPIVIKTIFGQRLTGANITSGQPVTFTTWTNTTLPMGGYNYCLHYSSPSITGITSFAISWNP